MEKQCRISIRLNASRAALLQRLCRENNLTVSEVIKQGLEKLAALDSPAAAVSRQTSVVVPTRTPPVGQPLPISNPPKLNELMAVYRAYGGSIWHERRRLFHRFFAAASAAMEHNESPRDLELFNELLRIGRTYELFK